MSDNLKVLQVFIASPNDLVDERRAIKEVADELNAAFGRIVGLQVQLLGWEDRLPGFGRAQSQINEDVDKADLFIGFLWRRWGTDPGNPKYTSGFEEEFNRAIERRERSGRPEISLFFKEVKITSANEIDDQLRRVLEFREKIASKKLLFREFTNIEEWRKRAKELLHGHLLMLLKSMIKSESGGQPQAPPSAPPQEPSKDATGQKDKTSTSTAKQQAIRAWEEALDAIKLGELSKFEKSETLQKLLIARIGLATASLTNREIEVHLPEVHLVNLLFKNRKQIELTQLEWLLILRSNLVSTGGFRPGWYWLRKTSLKVKSALVYFACNDEHRVVRTTALSYATKLNLPLLRKGRKRIAPIELLCSHDEADARKAGLDYLAKNGTTKELPLVEKLRTDSDSDVRAQAEVARNEILLRGNASQYFDKSVLASPWISDDGIRAIESHTSSIETENLRKALTHPDTKIAAFAAKELVARGSVTLEELEILKASEDTAEVIKAYYLKAIAEGRKFSPKSIRDAVKRKDNLFSGLLGPKRVETDEILVELFKTYSFDELKILADSDSEDTNVAYLVLAKEHFKRFEDQIRADLKSDFAGRRPKVEHQAGASLGSQFALFAGSLLAEQKPDLSDLTIAALSGLAANGNNVDRELVLPFLESKTMRIRIAALRALRRVGRPDDADAALRIADEAAEELAIEAATTALMLAPGETGSASNLFLSAKPYLLKLALISTINSDVKKVWPQIEHRLYDEDEEIRKLVCAFAIKKFSAPRLLKLLNDYVTKDRYFYNVVFFLDRVIYAKLPLRKIFLNEIEEALS